ncbi:hypothetical protein [Pseudonocardia sp. NPDC049635]|uniref:hypothetical protein n=1 Tax=Pseudonocardia sp. NPDC049635 TaxID=3155506 RepID=UPI0033F6FF53
MTAGCCGAAGIPDDLRETALHLLERLRGAIEPLAAGAGRAPEPGSPGACAACPVCAVVALLRGERSELAESLSVHATGVLAALAALLEQDTGPPGRGRTPDGGSGPAQQTAHYTAPAGHAGQNGGRTGGGRSVQRIVVHRT